MGKWYVPLQDEDFVMYEMLTFTHHRGRGIILHIAGTAMQEYGIKGGTAYVDCHVWNHSSIRAIEKLGFEQIATARPLRA